MESRRGVLSSILAGMAGAGVSPARAQVPNFPQTLPGRSVVGNRRSVAGPSEAIPFTQLAPLLGATNPVPAPLINVKAFGAVGDGVTDDTAAIQAAIDDTDNYGITGGNAFKGTIVFFPPGGYKTTAPLVPTNAGWVRLMGAGRDVSAITGNFAGYIIDNNNPVTGRFTGIDSLTIINERQVNDAGAIRFNASGDIGSFIRDLHIRAAIGINAAEQTYNLRIEGTRIDSGVPHIAGSVGVIMGQSSLISCSIVGYEDAVRCHNVGSVIHGCRIEVNLNGVIFGKDETGAVSQVNAFTMTGCSFERNDTSIIMLAGFQGLIAGCALTGVENVAGGGDIPYGMRWFNGSHVHVAALKSNVRAGVAGIDLSFNGPSNSNNVFSAVNSGPNGGAGVGWLMPGASWKSDIRFIGCNNPSAAFLFSQLPSSPVEGMQFNITNSNTATWGAVAAGGGANRVLVRYNGTNWTVVGR